VAVLLRPALASVPLLQVEELRRPDRALYRQTPQPPLGAIDNLRQRGLVKTVQHIPGRNGAPSRGHRSAEMAIAQHPRRVPR
jgi:hypothetical protein